jgi:hypothetical protein
VTNAGNTEDAVAVGYLGRCVNSTEAIVCVFVVVDTIIRVVQSAVPGLSYVSIINGKQDV